MKSEFLKALVKCRTNAGLTQEQASEKLCICVRSLVNYETGKTSTPDDIVNKMTQIYNAPALGYLWLRSTKTGQNLLPRIDKKSISENALCYLSSLDTANKHSGDLIRICLDNKIDATEQSRFRKIVGASKNLIKTLINICIINTER